MRRRLIALLHGRPGAILAIAVGITALSLFALIDPFAPKTSLRIPIDGSIDTISASQGERGEKPIFVALRFENLFRPSALGQVRDFVGALEALEGISRVDSLADAIRVDRSEGFLDARGALDVLPESDGEAEALGEEIMSSALYRVFVSGDRRSTLIAATPESDADVELASLRKAAREFAPDAAVRLSGTYVAEKGLAPVLVNDLKRTLPLALVALAAVASVALRSVRGVVLAVGANALATLVTVAFIAVLGLGLNIVTIITPAVVFVVGFSYSVHVLTDFDHHRREDDQDTRDTVARTLHEVAPPLVLTALTTCAGFLALLLSRIAAIREFGVICAIGVVAALVAALVVLPAALVFWPPPRSAGSIYTRFNDRWATRFASLAVHRRREVLAIGTLITLVACVGVLRIRSNTDFVSNFRADSAVRRDFESLNRDFAGGVPVEIEVRAAYKDAFLEPENLLVLRALQDRLQADPEVGHTTSIADYVSFLNFYLGGSSETNALPRRADGVDQLLLAAPEGARRFVDRRYRNAWVRVQIQNNASADLLAWVNRVESEFDATLPDHLSAAVVGNTVRVAKTVEQLTRGQVASVATALLVIFLVLSLLFQSLRAGFLALLPNIIPISVYFGTLGLLGIPLNVTTALVACPVLGIAVDDSIHFLTRFNEAARARASEASGVADALRQTIRPITVTTAALVAGFLSLVASELRNPVEFGVLAAFTLAFAWLLDLTFTPALCGKLRFVTLWETLTVDLGDEPHKTIPLFGYMSPRQARIAAVLGTIRAVAAGDRLLRRGDPGGSLFVVLDGEVEVSYPTDEGSERIAVLGRGALLGESSAFGGRSNANVDAQTDVRVLRWSRDNLDRIQSRHPRVAVPLLRKLSEIMAERWASTTERLHASPSTD